jgi:hypothetical protein
MQDNRPQQQAKRVRHEPSWRDCGLLHSSTCLVQRGRIQATSALQPQCPKVRCASLPAGLGCSVSTCSAMEGIQSCGTPVKFDRSTSSTCALVVSPACSPVLRLMVPLWSADTAETEGREDGGQSRIGNVASWTT